MNILSRLGLYGMGSIEPVILAALISEEPLLLIGRHGTAKSLLLTRLAQALQLEFRHYNASMINFDDVAGFPLPRPQEGGRPATLEYVPTPASAWGAEAVFFDEVSRCRPDMQNRMFPIVHERVLMGVPLERLRYRWAAMNPPADENGEESEYLGAEPLDPAFADRFAFIVEMPDWQAYSLEEQQAVILNDADAPVDDAAAQELRQRVAAGRDALQNLRAGRGERTADYVRPLCNLLRNNAGLSLSARRANLLCRAVLAVQAATLAARPARDADDGDDGLFQQAARLALRHALPQPAQGSAVPAMKLITAHREAWNIASMPVDSAAQALVAVADPAERIALATRHEDLDRDRLSGMVLDAFAALTVGAREAAAVHLFETDVAGRLNAAATAQIGQAYAAAVFPRRVGQIHRPSAQAGMNAARSATWPGVSRRVSRLLEDGDPEQHMLANVLLCRFDQNVLDSPAKVTAACAGWRHTRSRLRRARPVAAATGGVR